MSAFNLEVTLEKAVHNFLSEDPEGMAKKVAADYSKEKGMMTLQYLNQDIAVSYPSASFIHSEGLTIVEKILILHYLTDSTGQPLTNELISFKELPGGDIYNGPFYNRSIRPFLSLFGNKTDLFKKAAVQLGGCKQSLGDLSYTFKVLPKVPVTVVLWEGDDEFPASANILFDKAAADYLATEDYAVLSSLLVVRLKSLISAD